MKVKLKDGTLIAIREESSLYCIVPVETEALAIESIMEDLSDDNLTVLQIINDDGKIAQSGIDFSVAKTTIDEYGVTHIILRHLTNLEKTSHQHANQSSLNRITSDLVNKAEGGGGIRISKDRK